MFRKEIKALKTLLLALKETFEDNGAVETVAIGDHVGDVTSVRVVKGHLCEVSLVKGEGLRRSSRSSFIKKQAAHN